MRLPRASPRGSPPRSAPISGRRRAPTSRAPGAGRASPIMALEILLKILDPRLAGWGLPHYGSSLAAGRDLHACIDGPLRLRPQAPALLISAGIAFSIGDPAWCALVFPRSGLAHREGLVLGNA